MGNDGGFCCDHSADFPLISEDPANSIIKSIRPNQPSSVVPAESDEKSIINDDKLSFKSEYKYN